MHGAVSVCFSLATRKVGGAGRTRWVEKGGCRKVCGARWVEQGGWSKVGGARWVEQGG